MTGSRGLEFHQIPTVAVGDTPGLQAGVITGFDTDLFKIGLPESLPLAFVLRHFFLQMVGEVGNIPSRSDR